MKTSSVGSALGTLLDSLDAGTELWKCHQCGQCSSICPSYRNGGIRTREVMELTLMGDRNVLDEGSIWLCTMCNSCTERCQLGVDPASIINALRNLSAKEGKAPEHFRKEATLFIQTGLSFPVTGFTKKMREELDLEPLGVTERALEDLKIIIDDTAMGDLDLD